ncbi:MAG: flagellar hook-length control protein FliK [Pseudolabrys sp.]|nr:flagellar hook-length control protein FliK [Pseudolabrys sp.]
MSSVPLQPSLNAAAGASLAQLVALKPGDVMNALVLALLKDDTFRLQLPTGTLDVQTDKPLVPGTRVELAVKGTVAEPELFLTPLPDAKAARAEAAMRLGAQIETLARLPNARPDNIGQVAATIVRDAATRQGGMAQLYADLGASLAQPKVALPAPVVTAAQQLFALRLDATMPSAIGANDIKAALVRSGLTDTAPAASLVPRSAVPLDARAVLLALREALKNWESAERAPLATSASPAPSAPPAAPATARNAGPMLPYPNGPTVPQPAADPLLPANATPHEMALHLLDKTDSVIAREMLLKIASLPERTDTIARPAEPASHRMTFDIPMATPAGTTVAQMRIERDGAQQSGERLEPVWRANFSIDLEPIGAVHVRIALVGGKAAVTMNAERTESAESLSAGLPLLEAGLRKAELEPGALNCQAGQPVTASADHGLYVDHAS